MVLKDSTEEMFPIWLGEDDDPQLVRLITDIHSGRFVKGLWEVQGNAKGKGNEKKRMKGGVSSEVEPPTKKQKKVKTHNESEADAAGKGSSEKEGSKELELENKATLTTIVSTMDIISRKLDQVDSRLEAYELDRNRPLMDQKTIDDMVNVLLEERLKDLGIGKIPKNHDNPSPPLSDNSLLMASPVVRTHQKSVNSPALVAATPGKEFGLKKNLAKELEMESGVKRTLDEEFGSCIVKGEEADEKKKAAHAYVAFKRKKKAEAKKKEAEAKKKEAELKKKQEAELKKQKQVGSKYKKVTPPRDGVTRCKVQPDVEDSSLADITDEVVAEQNEFSPESDVENSKVFVECLALGVTFDGINDQNIQGLRIKMAADILAEGGNVVTDQMMAK
ncbi:unnamed protein product [Brassica napus]|nr:unnamed protein product [Brassica napus]